MNPETLDGDPARWMCQLLQAGDSFYPTGSYAHSFGLEGLVDLGVVHDTASLRGHLHHAVLPALARVELPLAAHAWRALSATPPAWEVLAGIAELAAALKPARELRCASENIGRQRAELAANLHRHPLAVEYLARAAANGWMHSAALSAALEGRVCAAPLEAVLAGMSYATLAGQLAAAMKVLRLGQNASQGLLTEVLGEVPALVAAARDLPLAEIGWFNPWLDIAAARHETASARLFIS
jgi:urease accessory protein